MKKSLGVLRPLEVPWELTQAVTGFCVEFADGYDCIVLASVNNVPDQESCELDQRVSITFEVPAQVTIMAAIGTRESVDLDQFDLSFLPSSDDYDRERFCKEWVSSRICPNPWAYRVDNSALVRELQLPRDNSSEYLLVGDDYAVDVVANGFSWAWVS